MSIDIGHEFTYRTFTEQDADAPTGIIIEGPAGPACPYRGNGAADADDRCAGGVHFETSRVGRNAGRPLWKVESLDPLTLSPSIACKCGAQHGHIRDGRYVPA